MATRRAKNKIKIDSSSCGLALLQ